MIKIIRLTTAPISLHKLLKGQPQFLQKRGFDVHLASANGNEISLIEEETGIKINILPYTRKISLIIDVKALWLTFKYLKNEKPDIIHSNTPKSSLLSMLAGFFARVPIRIYSVTGLRYQGSIGLNKQILMLMERITCFFATRVIPEGDGVKAVLITDKITFKPLKILGNGNINGINTSEFSKNSYLDDFVIDLCKQLKLHDNDVVFVFVGRIVKDKGINELLTAFDKLSKKYSNAKLLLVGPEERELDPINKNSQQILEMNKQVIHVGWQEDVRLYLAISDIFVFPSYREGFPNVVMQAGAMELPSIVTNINGSNEIIVDGVNGIIIPPKDENALYEKMELLLSNEIFRKKLAEPARKMIVDCFEQKFVWNELLKEYVHLLDSKNIKHGIKLNEY